MPVQDTGEARDLIIGVAQAAINTLSPTPKVLYADKSDEVPKDGDTWIRVAAVHFAGYKASLGNAQGKSRFRNRGIVRVEVHTPFGDGYTLSDQITTVIKNAFRKRSSSADKVSFSNVLSTEQPYTSRPESSVVGPEKGDGNWTRVDVTAEFDYAEVV